jgi:hypothetical protein
MGGDVMASVNRVRDLEAQVNDLKILRLSLQSEVQSMSNIGPNDEVLLDNLTELLQQLVSIEGDLDEPDQIDLRADAEISGHPEAGEIECSLIYVAYNSAISSHSFFGCNSANHSRCGASLVT